MSNNEELQLTPEQLKNFALQEQNPLDEKFVLPQINTLENLKLGEGVEPSVFSSLIVGAKGLFNSAIEISRNLNPSRRVKDRILLASGLASVLAGCTLPRPSQSELNEAVRNTPTPVESVGPTPEGTEEPAAAGPTPDPIKEAVEATLTSIASEEQSTQEEATPTPESTQQAPTPEPTATDVEYREVLPTRAEVLAETINSIAEFDKDPNKPDVNNMYDAITIQVDGVDIQNSNVLEQAQDGEAKIEILSNGEVVLTINTKYWEDPMFDALREKGYYFPDNTLFLAFENYFDETEGYPYAELFFPNNLEDVLKRIEDATGKTLILDSDRKRRVWVIREQFKAMLANVDQPVVFMHDRKYLKDRVTQRWKEIIIEDGDMFVYAIEAMTPEFEEMFNRALTGRIEQLTNEIISKTISIPQTVEKLMNSLLTNKHTQESLNTARTWLQENATAESLNALIDSWRKDSSTVGIEELDRDVIKALIEEALGRDVPEDVLDEDGYFSPEKMDWLNQAPVVPSN